MLERIRRALSSVTPQEALLTALLLFMVWHYRWIMDDAFIYFRYADNALFLGRGLVYNPNEYVEGYSSPAWMLIVLGLRALRLDYFTITLLLGFACASAYAALMIAANRKLTPAGIPTLCFPLAISAAHYGITTHFTGGLETPLVQVFAALYALALVQPSSRALQIAIAFSPLVRPELGAPAVLFAAWNAVDTKRMPWAFAITFVTVNAAWVAFRIWYYADVLPNTFYLKDGSHVNQGLWYLADVVYAHHWIPIGLALIALAYVAREHVTTPSRGARFAMLGIAAVYAAYVVRIGGDMLYHRYASFPVCLGACAGAGVCEAGLLRFAPEPRRKLAALGGCGAIVLLFALSYPPQYQANPFFFDSKSGHWHGIADAVWHRTKPDLRYSDARGAEDRALLADYAKLKPNVAPRLSLVTGWCRRAYNAYDQHVVHAYGLTDAVLSRVPGVFGRPGHKLVEDKAYDLARWRRADRFRHDAASTTRWLKQKRVPRWVKKNADSMKLIDRKIYNRHRFGENLRLALTHITFR
ncbi:MAG TPA: hypothetical protein VHM19_19775 [Polyangiales bacterium]|nr:hypothetical protein [Polyangiales bacterium]